jgi:hypothetical protein
MVSQLAEDDPDTDRAAPSMPAVIENDDLDVDHHAPWIEPVMGDPAWRTRMWGSIIAPHGRYPQARDWIDVAADDPCFELAFQAQLADSGQVLRQEGGTASIALGSRGRRQTSTLSSCPFEARDSSLAHVV